MTNITDLPSIIERELKDLSRLKPKEMSECGFQEQVIYDLLYQMASREKLISPSKTLNGRAYNTIRAIAAHPYFKGASLQVYVQEKGKMNLIAKEPETLVGELKGKNVESFRMENIGKLVVKTPEKFDAYSKYYLSRFAKQLELSLTNAFDYELNQELAARDSLTGLYNKSFFNAMLEKEIETEMEKGEQGLSLILLDIDHFKNRNDTLGHPVGDKILQELATLLPKVVTRKRDVIARVGGEEFGIIMPMTPYERALEKASAIRNRVEGTHFSGNDKMGKLTISGGVCHTSYAQDAETIYKLADEALYKAKEDRNTVVPYAEDI